MSNGPPEKIHLIPDEWHIDYVGRLKDGRLFIVKPKFDPSSLITRDFVCTFIFDGDGTLVEHLVDQVGGLWPASKKHQLRLLDQHLAALGEYEIADIWIRPFEIRSHGTNFGFVVRSLAEELEEGEDPADLGDDPWRVEFMPGNTLSFYAPWELGEYDT